MDKSAHLTLMINAVKKAAKGLIRDFGEIENLQVTAKGPGDFVSNADKRAEKIIIEELSTARPDYGILAEEGGSKESTSEYRWVIDPLDGTNNFLHGFPYWSISIGLEKAGEIVAGVVMAPILNEIFWAEKGKGAFLNDKRIRVSSRKNPSDAFMACGSPSSVRRITKAPFTILDVLTRLSTKVTSVRCVNSAALDLCYTAAGRFDGVVDLALKKWDIAGGIIILREAGGYVSGVSGQDDYYETGDIVASNYHLHDSLLKLLSTAK